MVKAAVDKGDQQVMQDARRIGQYSPDEPVASTSQVVLDSDSKLCTDSHKQPILFDVLLAEA
eukprot:scaffold121681_cov14-Tisochrysis_lutea.AAC.1